MTVRDVFDGNVLLDSAARIDEESFRELEKNGCRPLKGDVLFSKDGTVGRTALVTTDEPFVVLSSLAILRPLQDEVLPGFLALTLSSPAFQSEATGQKTGLAIKRVVLKNLKLMTIPVPPLPIQRRIVDLLAHLDAHIANLRTERDAANLARESLAENLLAQASGTEVRLGEYLEIARGGSPRPIDDYFTDSPDGLNWIKIGDVSATGKYITKTAQKIRPEGLSKTRRVSAGDFLLSNSMSFGRPYILCIDGCIHDGWLVLSDESGRFNQDFLYILLRSRSVQEQFAALAAGSGVKNLNISVVQSVSVKFPSRDEQQAVAATINEWESVRDSLDAELHSLEVTRRGLLDGLLAGDLGVPSAYDSLLVEVA